MKKLPTLSAGSERDFSRSPAILGSTPELPDDLQLEAVSRLRKVGLFLGILFLMAIGLGESIDRLIEGYWSDNFWDLLLRGGALILFSFAIYGVTKLTSLSPALVLRAGLAYQVLICYSMAIAEYWGVSYSEEQLETIGLTWVPPIMIFFAVVIPVAPRAAFITALLSGSSVPVAVLLTVLFGGTVLENMGLPQALTHLCFVHSISVALAYMGARVVYRLGTEVTRARKIGSYQLTELLGRGGMGEVWKAKHRLLARPAAVKLVRPELLGDLNVAARGTLVRRFEREAQATASMRSPHTIAIYDFGITADQVFYYVMEYLDGCDAETLVKRFGPLPAERAVHILRQLCHSLGEAHESGLIHRDIKPANIFVARYGREVDFTKVLDFGLVKSDESDAVDSRLTLENVITGTPAYMAPEQIMNDRPIDGRTDLYSVGCLAYWLLTGELVFDGNSPMEILTKHAQMAPIPPSERTELEIVEPLSKIVLSCLEKEPDQRPQTADELAHALEKCPIESVWTPERAKRWWEKHKPE